VQVKEIKLRPGTDEGDYDIKMRNMKRFLEEGDKVKITLRFAVAKWRTRNWVQKCLTGSSLTSTGWR
jgi:translation initiation factor IF-3